MTARTFEFFSFDQTLYYDVARIVHERIYCYLIPLVKIRIKMPFLWLPSIETLYDSPLKLAKPTELYELITHVYVNLFRRPENHSHQTYFSLLPSD